MAETVHLFLKANGADIKGDSTQTSLGRENSIECISYDQNVNTAREAATGMATGRRVYEPVTILKRIDKATPLIAKALTKNEVIEGKFLFFRPHPNGDGTTQQYYTVEISKGRVAHQKQYVPNTPDPSQAGEHPLEEVSFTFHTIKWTFTDGGVSHEDTWSANT
jgi:type VI secretion system secreted protein Hcp